MMPNSDRPYFDAWLRRTGRRLAASGQLAQVATVLAASEGGTVDAWRTRLRNLLDGGETPSLDLLVQIDMLLAKPCPKTDSSNSQTMLFD